MSIFCRTHSAVGHRIQGGRPGPLRLPSAAAKGSTLKSSFLAWISSLVISKMHSPILSVLSIRPSVLPSVWLSVRPYIRRVILRLSRVKHGTKRLTLPCVCGICLGQLWRRSTVTVALRYGGIVTYREPFAGAFMAYG